ncbi:hypothetical protein KPL71_023890 [Citrus sinensis]|uniref:Uncharacterized protein n=1 Tax=Citrus sinensis TaxID=2711 RepID=A0ACB8IM31_CITSI|nr:hypothetical protein KPL71_023890 [Citrus sinensis]
MAQPDQPDHGQTSHTEPYVDIPSEVEDDIPEFSATNQPPPAQAQTGPTSQKSSNGPWFTFDDIPSSKWRDRLTEMSVWIDLQMLRPGATTQSVLREFATRFTGDPYAVFEAARRDYLNIKCCSLNAKDLDFYYKRMSLLFYKLNGFNEPTLKHVFLASLPEELRPDIQRQLTASNLILDNISLGKIFQIAKTCLDKLCEQKQFFKELLKDKEPFRSACKKPYLQIKCFSPEKDEPEFYFSEQDEPNDETVFAMQTSSDESDSDVSQVIFHQQLLSLDTTIPIPSIKLHILSSKFQRPIPAIGLIDTGAQRSMLNPNILPLDSWTKYEENFRAVNGKLFTTTLITKKPIGSHDEHRQLLTQFYDIVQSHGIMLSAKKSTIGTDNIEFLGKTVSEKMLLRLKDWFSKYDFSVKHIKGSQNLIPDMLSRLSKLSKLEKSLTLVSTTYHFPIISMATSLPPEALSKKTFPLGKTFTFIFAIQEFTRKAVFRFFMKAYLLADSFPFSTFHPENLFLTGLTLDPSRDITEDELWYIWCLTVLYATKLALPITPTLNDLLDIFIKTSPI